VRNELSIEKIVRQRSIDGQRSPPLGISVRGVYDKLMMVPCQRSFLDAGTLTRHFPTRTLDVGGMKLVNGNSLSHSERFFVICGTHV
jgi:hypothetical protein